MDFKFKIDKWPDLAKKYPAVMKLVSVEALRVIMARIEGKVVENTPAGVGGSAGLRGSINGKVVHYGQRVQGSVGSPLEYAAPVEYGTKPHFPPVAPIELWCQRKLGLDGKEAQSVALAIARKIRWKGTKGAHMFERAMTELQPWIDGQVRDIPNKVIKRIG